MYTEAGRTLWKLQILEPRDVKGNLTKAIVSDDDKKLLLVFDNGKFAVYEAERGFDDDCQILISNEDPDAEHAYRAGLLTAEQYTAERDALRTAADDFDRKEFERLKQKFANTPSPEEGGA